MQKFTLIIGVFLCLLFHNLNAQNPATIDVNSLSDRQIQQIINEVNSKGLTIDEAAALAQTRGATSTQIEDLKRRIQGLNMSQGKSVTNTGAASVQTTNSSKETISEKAKVKATTETKKIFGFQLFNSENLTFEPPVNIPTPQNYVIGIQDELTISIWGASQQTYQLRVETNGAVNIPDIGPVYVAGMEFTKAKELIKRRLIAIYQGMEGATPNTYAEVSISNLRSIKVNVIGEVMAPGTYTLPSTASAFNALYLSGGPNKNGSFRNIQVLRDNKVIKNIDVYDYLINANTQGNIQLREQDVIYIPTYKKRVEAKGAFKRVGIFELTEKEKLSDFIRYVGGFTDEAFKSQLSLTRITDSEKKVIDISQNDYENFVPNNGDILLANSIIDRYENRVTITGAVFRPGGYALTEGLTLSGLIKKAQGVKESYFSNRGLILRLQDNMTPMTVSFNVDDILKGVKDIQLQREDQVVIQDIFNLREKRSVHILGEIQNPGQFDFSEEMTLKDLIFRAGGFNEAASESFIEVARRHNYAEANQINDELVKLYQFTIDRALKLDNKADTFHLQAYDYVYVRKAPSYFEQRTVTISGEVKYPGPYSIGSKSERISDLIKRAGGLTTNAFTKGARMYRVNQHSTEVLNALENALPDSLSEKAVKQVQNSLLELRLDDILRQSGTAFDYILRDGDQIVIPEIAQEVRLSGEILNPIGLAYLKGKNLKYYINRSGGFSSEAQKRKIFVVYSDGTTRVTQSGLWVNYPPIEPGCQIIIPKKPEKQRTDQTGKWLGIASTMATISIAIATLLKL